MNTRKIKKTGLNPFTKKGKQAIVNQPIIQAAKTAEELRKRNEETSKMRKIQMWR